MSVIAVIEEESQILLGGFEGAAFYGVHEKVRDTVSMVMSWLDTEVEWPTTST